MFSALSVPASFASLNDVTALQARETSKASD